ncbi:M23 family metallopeptidase [Wenzhouxiangella sp. XN79A]|uniref:M23 family metallopeptidase n=1 Tax=Wenzhouxiangella sp. XN79A TaxID=2724193 RepID=UPI00144A8C40|nr:M23 family metallopeptidase [Wenzhouxiangella sp. XN79A]NKI33796.1 M23 family metallopeptidase [Wenzhouxiangella sp. XN79A]
MRQHYRITVSDYRGARHYTLSQVMWRAALGGAGVVALVFLGSLMVIQLLSGRIDGLNGDLAELREQNRTVEERNHELLSHQNRLNEQIDSRARELIALTDELEQLETIIGVRPPEALPVAERISVASHTALERRLLLTSVPSGYPLAETRITSGFGMRDHPVTEGTRLHGGVDMRAAPGTPVLATADGVVEWAGPNPGSGLGTMVKLVHNYGFTTLYAHLDDVDVRVGQYVREGEPIGKSGNTGLSAAPHLHYEVRYLGRRLDPRPFLDWSLDRYDLVFEKEERVQWESLAETVRSKVRVLDPPSSDPTPSWSAISP